MKNKYFFKLMFISFFLCSQKDDMLYKLTMENFMDIYNVSRETYDKLKLCQQALCEWQNKFNLVSKNSLEDAWNRHFLDSAQLFPLIPATARSLVDLGSGAGFPGIVLAVMSAERTPYLKFTLVESTAKKTVYLNYLKKICKCENIKVVNQRIENLINNKFDVVTARALTSLNQLLAYAYPLLNKNGLCLFPKGKSFELEIKEAQKKWIFEYQTVQSQTSTDSVVLIVKNIKPIRRS